MQGSVDPKVDVMINEKRMPYRSKSAQSDTPSLIARVLELGPIDPRRSYSEQLFEALRLSITRSRLPPGTVLSEAAIAEAAGLSRTPVREALRQLALERLVDVYPQAGTVVAPIRISLVKEACFVRGALESANFAELAVKFGARDRSFLRNILADQEMAMREGRLEDFMNLDDRLHSAAFELMGRARVWNLIDNGKVHLDRVRYLLLERLAVHAGRVLADHERLLDLLENGKADELAKASRIHVDKATLDLLELQTEVPEAYFTE